MSLACRPAAPSARLFPARPSLAGGPSPAGRAVICLWMVLGVALAARTLYRPHSHTVFPIFVTAAEHWWEDRPLYLAYKPLDYFRYPPPFAVVLTPLARLGPA